MTPDPAIDLSAPRLDAEFLTALRIELVKFARLQLGSDDEAEDAVQEALVGALKNAPNFRREAAFKTWVIAILKNKIADIIRQRQRRPVYATDMGVDDPGNALPELFDRRGMWRDANRPARWENPEADMHDQQFLGIFDICLNRLPPRQGRVFMMREVVELESEEICIELGLSINNLYVILHRARLALRACLENHWFKDGAGRP